jgi:hypothetical protein
MSNYIYLLQEREFKTTGQNIYKLGKTKQENLRRFKQYPKGSKLLLQQVCDNCDMLEIELIRDFKKKYIHRRDIGNEYFEGDYNDMIKYIHNKLTHNAGIGNMAEDDEDKNENDKKSIFIDNNEYHIWFDKHKYDVDLFNKIKDYHRSKNIEIIKEFNQSKELIISSYEQFKKVSKSIKSMIIVDKSKQQGFILLKGGNHWHKIDAYNHTIPDEEQEHLLGWLKHHTKGEYEDNDIYYYTIDEFKEQSEIWMENGVHIGGINKPFRCDYYKIIKDICKKCFDENPKLYNLQYNEYLVSIHNCDRDVILNTKTLTIQNYNPEADGILTGCDKTANTFYLSDTLQFVDTKIVDDAIQCLLDQTTYQQYKQLCYNVLVEDGKEIILEDNYGYITGWLRNVSEYLIPAKSEIIISNDKSSDKMPTKYNNEIRLVIIKYNTSTDKQVTKLRQLGFKNIIISKPPSSNNQSYIKFITENKDKILQVSHYDENELKDCFYNKENNYISCVPYEIFDAKRLLFNNFLKWCCLKCI